MALGVQQSTDAAAYTRPIGFRFPSTDSAAMGSTIMTTPPGLQRLARPHQGAGRIAKVVEAIKKGDEVVAARVREIGGAGDIEVRAAAESALESLLARVRDRRGMIIESVKLGVRIGLRHDERRGPVAAADVGNGCSGLEFPCNSVQGGDPLGDQVRRVPGPEKALRAFEKIMMMFAPEHSLARF